MANVPDWCAKYNVPRASAPAKREWEPPSPLKPSRCRKHLEVVEVKLLRLFTDVNNRETGETETIQVKLGCLIQTADGTRWVRHRKGNWSVRHEGETKGTPIGNGHALRRVYPHMADTLINAYQRWLADGNSL